MLFGLHETRVSENSNVGEREETCGLDNVISMYGICIYSVVVHYSENKSMTCIWPHGIVNIQHHSILTFHAMYMRSPFLCVLLLFYLAILYLWIIFSKVEGKGFKLDATQLAAHLEFLHTMLFDENGCLGNTKEGTDALPIIVQGCAKSAFTNFSGWLNHKWVHCPWCLFLISINKISIFKVHGPHMRLIMLDKSLTSSKCLTCEICCLALTSLAENFFVLISALLTVFTGSEIQSQHLDWRSHLKVHCFPSWALYKWKYTHPSLSTLSVHCPHQRIHLSWYNATCQPSFFPPNDGQLYCSHHETCKQVWTEKWFYTMGGCIHNLISPLPLLKVPDALEALDHPGMNCECKSSILTWMWESCAGLQREEIAISRIIATVHLVIQQQPVEPRRSFPPSSVIPKGGSLAFINSGRQINQGDVWFI